MQRARSGLSSGTFSRKDLLRARLENQSRRRRGSGMTAATAAQVSMFARLARLENEAEPEAEAELAASARGHLLSPTAKLRKDGALRGSNAEMEVVTHGSRSSVKLANPDGSDGTRHDLPTVASVVQSRHKPPSSARPAVPSPRSASAAAAARVYSASANAAAQRASHAVHLSARLAVDESRYGGNQWTAPEEIAEIKRQLRREQASTL